MVGSLGFALNTCTFGSIPIRFVRLSSTRFVRLGSMLFVCGLLRVAVERATLDAMRFYHVWNGV